MVGGFVWASGGDDWDAVIWLSSLEITRRPTPPVAPATAMRELLHVSRRRDLGTRCGRGACNGMLDAKAGVGILG